MRKGIRHNRETMLLAIVTGNDRSFLIGIRFREKKRTKGTQVFHWHKIVIRITMAWVSIARKSPRIGIGQPDSSENYDFYAYLAKSRLTLLILSNGFKTKISSTIVHYIEHKFLVYIVFFSLLFFWRNSLASFNLFQIDLTGNCSEPYDFVVLVSMPFERRI